VAKCSQKLKLNKFFLKSSKNEVILEGFHRQKWEKKIVKISRFLFVFLFSVCSHEYTRLIKELYSLSG
jgi:hypothetical protein